MATTIPNAVVLKVSPPNTPNGKHGIDSDEQLFDQTQADRFSDIDIPLKRKRLKKVIIAKLGENQQATGKVESKLALQRLLEIVDNETDLKKLEVLETLIVDDLLEDELLEVELLKANDQRKQVDKANQTNNINQKHIRSELNSIYKSKFKEYQTFFEYFLNHYQTNPGGPNNQTAGFIRILAAFFTAIDDYNELAENLRNSPASIWQAKNRYLATKLESDIHNQKTRHEKEPNLVTSHIFLLAGLTGFKEDVVVLEERLINYLYVYYISAKQVVEDSNNLSRQLKQQANAAGG